MYVFRMIEYNKHGLWLTPLSLASASAGTGYVAGASFWTSLSCCSHPPVGKTITPSQDYFYLN